MKMRLVYFLNDSLIDGVYFCDSSRHVIEIIEGDKEFYDNKREQNRIVRNLEAIKEWLEAIRSMVKEVNP